MNKNLKQKIFIFLLAMVLMIGQVACAPETPKETEQLNATWTITPELTATMVPQSPTLTPSLSKVILVTSADANPFVLAQSQQQIASLAADAGLDFEVVENLVPEVLGPNVKAIVGVGPGINLDDIATSNPEISFLIIDQRQVALTGNISQIGDPIQDMQHMAFMAGYLAALISSDYKIAALVPSDIDESDLILDSFMSGARFFCGICRPKYPPYNTFPQWETIPSEAANQDFYATVDTLINQGVEILYVSGDLATPSLLSYLRELGVNVVGDTQPEQVSSNWLGTVGVDYAAALVELWPQIVDGVGGVRLPAPITLMDRNLSLVSEGRYRLFLEMAADLQAGLIAAGSAP